MTNLRAIETRYAGCRFRSRLEARWAVFFDTLGLAWEYEPEGFQLAEGPYLPDFKITGLVAANWPYVDAFSMAMINENSAWFEVKPDNAGDDPRHAALARASECTMIVAKGLPRTHTGIPGTLSIVWWCGCGPVPARIQNHTREWARAVDRAFTAARSARFEFGESGA